MRFEVILKGLYEEKQFASICFSRLFCPCLPIGSGVCNDYIESVCRKTRHRSLHREVSLVSLKLKFIGVSLCFLSVVYIHILT